MTYCVGILLDAGMVFASDSRTNAGVDNVSSYRKMRVFERPADRVVVIMSSGNLSVTQNAINLLEQNARRTDGTLTLWNAQSLFEVAQLLGDCLREVKRRDGPYLMQNNIDSSASFILGGQIQGEPMRLFMVYAEGNFIEATPETPFFQIGETKYGKPIIDRVIKPTTSLTDAAKCVLVSFDSTMRSNVSVGLPIDLLVYERDALRVGLQRRILESDPYFNMIHTQWGEGLRRVFAQLPNPTWGEERTPS
ncbi:MAG: proteasome-type protease [Burkholderiales bacterium]|nr:proteasome-type protease [Burkholderiales bacterium]